MSLGTVAVPKEYWKQLATVLEARLAGRDFLIDAMQPEVAGEADRLLANLSLLQAQRDGEEARQATKEIVAIDVQSLATSEIRSLGPELVACDIWSKLGFDQTLTRSGFDKKQVALAKVAIIGRLINPGSERATWQWFQNRTALVEMLDIDLKDSGVDALYDIADMLLDHKTAIEDALRDRTVTLFNLQPTVLLYDLTNAYFEGSCKGNELAQRGKSKEKRSDCPLVTLALVVDDLGFIIFSQIYPGNMSEPKTLRGILDQLYSNGNLPLQGLRPTIVMDRGIATAPNIALLREEGFPYTVIERRNAEEDYEDEFQGAREKFQCISKPSSNPEAPKVYAKSIPWGDGTRVLCFSEGRERKERAIGTAAEKRLLDDLDRLRNSVAKGNIVQPEKVSQRIGRLQQKHSAIARHFDISTETDSLGKRVVDINWTEKQTKDTKSSLTGCYVIETSHNGMTAADIWKLYMTLSNVERAFRDLKTELGMRPIYHQSSARTSAHLFISVLAYHLLAAIEYILSTEGDHRCWKTIKGCLSTHARNTVIFTDAEGSIHHIRVSSLPEAGHKGIYATLRIKDCLKRKRTQVSGSL